MRPFTRGEDYVTGAFQAYGRADKSGQTVTCIISKRVQTGVINSTLKGACLAQ